MFRLIGRGICRMERAVLRWHRFCGDVVYYQFTLRKPFREAVRSARNTIYP